MNTDCCATSLRKTILANQNDNWVIIMCNELIIFIYLNVIVARD